MQKLKDWYKMGVNKVEKMKKKETSKSEIFCNNDFLLRVKNSSAHRIKNIWN